MGRVIPLEAAATLAGLFRERIRRTPDTPAYRNYNSAADSWQDWNRAETGRMTMEEQCEPLDPREPQLTSRHTPVELQVDSTLYCCNRSLLRLHCPALSHWKAGRFRGVAYG